jgi:inosine-uridine nucleoside N-ribohydrolase
MLKASSSRLLVPSAGAMRSTTTRRILLLSISILLAANCCAELDITGQPVHHRIILDTDFTVRPPADDAMAFLLALQSPEIEILGITTVAGNYSLEQSTADALRVLEVLGREDIPVYPGAKRPLVHEASDWDRANYGEWYSDSPPLPPLGAFAKKPAEKLSAADFIAKTVQANAGRITIVAIGPLTNIALAISSHPGLAKQVKALVIMGGAIASLPDGAGNQTPNAEYNFWVDPEAARTVLRSGIPVQLSPLNVSRKTNFVKKWYDRMVQVDTPVTRLIGQILGPQFAEKPERRWAMFDEVAVGSLIDPTLVKTQDLFVDVDINHGISYGVSIGGTDIWPGAEGSKRISVQYDLDWERFIHLFIARVTSPTRSPQTRNWPDKQQPPN